MGWIIGGGIVILITIFAYQLLFVDRAASQSVKKSEIQITTVIKGEFQEFFLANGYIAPAKSIFIDTREAGIVESVSAEQGNTVVKGQILLTLRNDELQSQLSLGEAALQNEMKDLEACDTRKAQTQNRDSQQLLELDHQIDVMSDELDRQQARYAAGAISASEVQKTKKELTFAKDKRPLLLASHALDLSALEQETAKIRSEIGISKIGLQRLTQRIGTLTVASPAYGQITAFNASVGEMKIAGSRVAQLDIMDTLKLKADIDEYYLPKIQIGNEGSLKFEDAAGNVQVYGVAISWISPDVKNNSFEVEFKFVSSPPSLRVGQRFLVRVDLGPKEEAVLLGQGQFSQGSGKGWVFVVDPSGAAAAKREISIGRSNPDYVEIKAGLTPGERVVTSDYSRFANMQRINLQ